MEKILNSRSAQARRTDLIFRTKYLEVKTIVYQIDADNYIIHCDSDRETFVEMAKDFDHSIKPVTLRINLSLKAPAIFQKVLPNILDNEIPKDFAGIFFSKSMLYNLLLSKFPSFNIHQITDDQDSIEVHVYNYTERGEMGSTKKFLSNADKERLINFVEGIGIGIPTKIVETSMEEPPILKPTSESMFALNHFSAPQLQWNKVPEFQQRDEALWYDNIENIYEGRFTKSDLYFFEEDDYCCYLDYSAGNHIDIRNFLLLYRTLFITPPFEKKLKQWLEEEKIRINEFFHLVESGRIRFLLTQVESRYDDDFLAEMYNTNKSSIITRRGAATLLQADINELAENYFFAKDTDFKLIRKFADAAGSISGIDSKHYFDMLTWPIRARRESFENLQWSPVHGTPNHGVNNFIAGMLKNTLKRDFGFEFLICSSNIHIAHALNATYYPYKTKDGFSDSFFANIMGNYLNIFKNTSIKLLDASVGKQDFIPEYRIPLSPIEIFQINDFLPIEEFEQIAANAESFKKGGQLMEHLSKLSPEARAREIARYNFEVNRLLKKGKDYKKSIVDLVWEAIQDGIGAASEFTWMGTVFSILKSGAKSASSIKEINDLKNIIQDKLHPTKDKQNIHFLTKINRVARIEK